MRYADGDPGLVSRGDDPSDPKKVFSATLGGTTKFELAHDVASLTCTPWKEEGVPVVRAAARASQDDRWVHEAGPDVGGEEEGGAC